MLMMKALFCLLFFISALSRTNNKPFCDGWICSNPEEAPSQHVDVRVHSDGCSFPVERLKMGEKYKSIEAFRTSTPPDENTLGGRKKKSAANRKKKDGENGGDRGQEVEAEEGEEKFVASVLDEAKKRLFSPTEKPLTQKYFAVSTRMAESSFAASSAVGNKEQGAIALKRHTVRKIAGIIHSANFSKCCTLHDACYSLCNVGRRTCEDRFSSCLRQQCEAAEFAQNVEEKSNEGKDAPSFSDRDICNAYAVDVAEAALTSDYSKKQFDMNQKEACYCVEHQSTHEGLLTAASSLIDHLHEGSSEEEKIHQDHPKSKALVQLNEKFEAMHKYAIKAHKKKFNKERYPNGIPDSREGRKKYEAEKRNSQIQRNEELSRKFSIYFLDNFVEKYPEGIVHTKNRYLPGSHMYKQAVKKAGSKDGEKKEENDDDGTVTDEL